MRLAVILLATLIGQAPPRPLGGRPPGVASGPLEKSAYFVFIDREYIFTIEVVKPGVPILNFVCMGDKESNLLAKDVTVALENRKVAGRIFLVDTGDPKQPLATPTMRIRPRSSFGTRVDGDFGDAKEFYGVTIRLGGEEFRLIPVSSLDFENLALKIGKLNLGSPDFSDDWRVLGIQVLGTRVPVRSKRY